MAELNELFEEAAGQCSALSDELDDTVAGLDSMVGKASELWETVSRGGEQVRRRLRELTERMDAAEAALEGARADAVGGLDALASEAEAVRGHVGELLGQVRERLQDLEQQQSQLDESLGEQMQAVGTDYSDLGRRIQETQESIATQVQEAGEAVNRFGQAVDAARNELNEKKDAWSEALDELESTAQEKTREWVAGLQSVLADQTTAMVDVANRMLVKHNDTMEELKTKFAVEAAHEVGASIQPLQDSLEKLSELAASRGGEISARSEEALQRVRAALPVLEELRTAFEQSSRLGQER